MAGSHDPSRSLNKQSPRPASPPPTPPNLPTGSSSSSSHLQPSAWYPTMNDPSSSSSSSSGPSGPAPRSPHRDGSSHRYLPATNLGLTFDDDDTDDARGGPKSPPPNTLSPYRPTVSRSVSATGPAQSKAPTSRLGFNAPKTPGDPDRDDSRFKADPYLSTSPPYNHRPLSSTSPAPGKAGGAGAKLMSAPEWVDSTATWLGLYFCFNLGLTLFNKIVLVSFPFPYVSQTLSSSRRPSLCPAGCRQSLAGPAHSCGEGG